jgi:hypothetical protein
MTEEEELMNQQSTAEPTQKKKSFFMRNKNIIKILSMLATSCGVVYLYDCMFSQQSFNVLILSLVISLIFNRK